MTVQAGPTDKRYVANGVTTTFAIPFLIIQKDDLQVLLNGVVITSGFTLIGVGNPTSTIVFDTAPTGDLYLVLDVEFERLFDYQENGDFLARTVNLDFDRIWQALKQLFRYSVRALTLGSVDVDGAGWYRAKGNGIRDLHDPVETQDAATKGSVEAYVAGILATGQGPVNNAANVLYTYPDLIARALSTLATKNDPLLGSAGIAHNAGTVRDALANLDEFAATPDRQLNDVLRTLSGSAIGDLSAFSMALASGTVTIVVVGDSIAEGKSQVNIDDSWPMVMIRALRETYKGVTFNLVNLSLAGRGTGNLFSDAYVGIAGPDNPAAGFFQAPGSQSTGHWPAGSTIGKSWREHIRDQAPDLIIQALGMNDLTGTSNDTAATTSICLDYYRTFTKVPSVALMTPMQPAALIPPFSGYQEIMKANAEVYRGLALQNNHTLLDANRLCLLYRDAVDFVNTKGHRRLLPGFPTGWTKLSGTGFTESAGVLTGNGVTRRDELVKDVYMDMTFALANYSTLTPAMQYRMDPADPNKSYSVNIAVGNTVILYWNLTVIASAPITPLTNGAPVRIEVKCRGALHQVYVNRVLVLTKFDYNKLSEGVTSVQIDGGTGTVSNYTLVKFVPTAVGRPMFNEGDLLGFVNDFDTNPDSLGGSTGNHPSALGHSVMYANACLPLFRCSIPKDKVVILNAAIDTLDFYGVAAGAYAQVNIDGVSGPISLVCGSVGSLLCPLHHAAVVTGGRTVLVKVVSNSSLGVRDLLPISLVLPAGRWLISATANLTNNAAGIRNSIDAVAHRIF